MKIRMISGYWVQVGLGHLGLENKTLAVGYLQKASDMDINHFGVQVHLSIALK